LTRRWLRLVEEGEDRKRARWRTHPTWLALQQGFDPAMRGAPLNEEKSQLVRKERHTGYERFSHRIEVGALAMMDAEDTDPAATAHAWMAHLAQCLDLANQAQAEMLLAGSDLKQVLKGMGVMGGDADRRYLLKGLLDELFGLFTSSGVVRLGMREVSDVAELPCWVVSDLEAIAKEKGGLGQLLYEKRRKIYRLSSQRFFRQSLAA
jgi:hypothetical protein